MGLFDKLQAKLELYRLEQRYTRREKRTTFFSDAQYVDGEYVYATSPTSSKTSSTNSTANSSRRFSKVPGVRIRELARSGTGRS
ncbi:hypothetical protein K458DRAFT_385489 [Lentithecium fluviatile CBS 122367]|uniref:Uncharacterized protein n=1 Tax=Lentithecium fluviatile CBS 122367 TaxID=1168545 RepID=A0A6G1JBI3_9PLEO|nr:hypothetical protein K458DRAFT_385489 [Lentithecium fluviatile CBS 122367]